MSYARLDLVIFFLSEIAVTSVRQMQCGVKLTDGNAHPCPYSDSLQPMRYPRKIKREVCITDLWGDNRPERIQPVFQESAVSAALILTPVQCLTVKLY